jgi:hypothetical protein
MKINEEDKNIIQEAITEKITPIDSLVKTIHSIKGILNFETTELLLKSIDSIIALKDIFSNIELDIDYNTDGTDIEGFPSEIIKWLLTQQKLQKLTSNIDVFKKNRISVDTFLWADVKLPIGCKYSSSEFCSKVIEEKNFDLFFEVFPKNK